MAMAILPAVQVGGAAIAKAMPSLISTLQKYAPTTMNQLSRLTGSKSPEVLARAIASTGNGMQAQGLLFNAVRAGATIEMISAAVPLLSESDRTMLASHHVEYVAAARAAVDAQQVVVPVPSHDAPSAEEVKQIEGAMRVLGLTRPVDLADLIVAFETVKTSTIAKYEAYFTSIGRKRA